MFGPGRVAPARLFSGVVALAFLLQASAATPQTRRPGPQPQTRAPAQAPARPNVPLPAPDHLTLLKLLWSTMAAIDQANKTGNYSVLRDLGTTDFQANNNAATLAGAFAALRNNRIDLSDTLLVTPAFEFPPAMLEANVLRMRGVFTLRPNSILFDLIYRWSDGWRLHAVAISPVAAPVAPR